MNTLEIDSGIIIDDVETAVDAINRISSSTLTDPYVIKKFVDTQKATKFYLDNKGAAKMTPDKESVYLWLDTGFVDDNGNAIFLSLLNNNGMFKGHFAGTKFTLGRLISDYFRQNKHDVNVNMKKFDQKYTGKISCRSIKHIDDEQKFFIDVCNEAGKTTTEIGKKLRNLQIVFDDSEEDAEDLLIQIEEEPDNPEIEKSALDILWDKIDELEEYIATLLSTIEELTVESNQHLDRIRELQEKNTEYIRALTQIRQFNDDSTQMRFENNDKEKMISGHKILRGNKVLVLGATVVSVDVMKSMLKFFGFEKTDFEFETDYDKIKKFAGRVTTEGRYSALILGASPHKVSDSNGWSSMVEKFKNIENGPFVIDVRNSSGELKITKNSFKMALEALVKELS